MKPVAIQQVKIFEKRLLAVAVAAALGSAAGTASAFAPVWNTVAKKTDADVEIWHGGATASTSSLQKAVVEAFCDSGQDVDILEDARVVGKPAFWSVACVGKAGLPASLVSKKILWSKRDDGGSGVGVGPVALGSEIGFMMPSTGFGNNCPSITGTRVINGSITANVWNCPNFTYDGVAHVPAVIDDTQANSDAVRRPPVIGTSDIEPDKFIFAENIPASDLNMDGFINAGDALTIDSDDLVGLKATSVAQLVFGVPVNWLMYQDLQRAQFPGPTANVTPAEQVAQKLYDNCNPSGANYLKTTDTLAATTYKDKKAYANSEMCMPSLMGTEIRSIFASGGAIRSAADMQKETAYHSGTFVAMSATGTTDQTIQIIRRVKGSGTQAQFNAIMLGYPCDPTGDGTIDTLVPQGGGGFNTFVTVNEGSGDVEKALNDYNNGTNTSGQNGTLKKRWAIGLQSLEKNANLANDYRFIKIDGYAPTLANVHAGDYYDVAEQSMQYKTAGAAAATVDAYNTLVPFLQNPASYTIAPGGLNNGTQHSFGVSGWLAIPSNSTVPFNMKPDAELDFTRPVGWFRRVSFSGKANTCALPSAFLKKTVTGAPDVDITVAPQNCSALGSDNTDSTVKTCYAP